MLPFAECILRCSPMKVLGSRCPYEVVTGLKPRLPMAAFGGQVVEFQTRAEYVGKLHEYWKQTHAAVTRLQNEEQENWGTDFIHHHRVDPKAIL